MNLLTISDLHTEFMSKKQSLRLVAHYIHEWHKKSYDVMVLAGDVGAYKHVAEILILLLKEGIEIVFVLGNHEYYYTKRENIHARMYVLQAEYPNFHWLSIHNNPVAEIQGQRFVGDTMWFPSAPDEFKYRKYLSDFSYIERFTSWVYDHNEAAQEALRDNIQQGDVVVTHHAPSQKSIIFEYRNEPTNIFYVCDMEDAIKALRPALWIHGHMHASLDYKISQTSVICNPFGYEGVKTNMDFVQDKIIVV